MDQKLNRRTLAKTAGALAGSTTLGHIAPVVAQDATLEAGYPVIELPGGYQIEKVVDELTYPTSVTWDDQGQMYVAEAGGAFLEEPPPARILRIENGQATEVVNLTEQNIGASVVGLVWHEGAFYFTHRDAKDRTGAASRVTPDGEVTLLFNGIVDSQTDHQTNDIQVGPDGRMYVASGAGGNSAVMGQDMLPFLLQSPETHTTVCQDIVLTGQNFLTPNILTDDPSDMVLTGAFVPFGTETTPGQVIKGRTKCGGSIIVFDPDSDNPEETLEVYAWGFRNIIGFTWNDDGEMYASQNGYDVTPSRPVKDEFDPTYRIEEGVWYGWPDFSAAFEPVTDPKFDAPDKLKAPVYVNGQLQGTDLGFVIDHAASGLTPPDPALIAGLHEVNSSPSKLDVAPESWGDMAGQLFVAEWGDLAWFTNALRDKPAGFQVSRIDPTTGQVEPFVRNAKPGPASAQEAMGQGIERPFDVKFGPDGAMYIVDYGVARINLARIAEGHLPYEFLPGTGVVWKVTSPGGETPVATQSALEEILTPEGTATESVIEEILTPEATP
jgi:glucose/arabinose dehydrogenase